MKLEHRLRRYQAEFGGDKVFFITNGKLRCLLCEVFVNTDQASRVAQHCHGHKHIKALEKLKNKPSKQLSIQLFDSNDSANLQFARDTCRMFLSAIIPLHKLGHPAVKAYLSKYTGREPPSVTSARNHQEQIYLGTIDEIRRSISNNYIWVSLDETTGSQNRYIVLVVVGIMCATAPTITHLINLDVVDK